jgi:hypothetical protein
MLQFLLTVTGAISIVALVSSVYVAEHRSFLEGILFFLFGLFSFIATAVLTNLVFP